MAMPPPQSTHSHGSASPFAQGGALPLGTPGNGPVGGGGMSFFGSGAPSGHSSSSSPYASHSILGQGVGLPNFNGIPSVASATPAASTFPPGSATLRMLEYCDGLSGKGSTNETEIHNLAFWRDLTQEFFTPDGVFRQVAWNPSAREQRAFELPTPVIPRYLHTVHLSGVVSHSVALSQPREWSMESVRSAPSPPMSKGAILGKPNAKTTHFVQVEKARFHIEYENGWMVVQTGVLRAALTPFKGTLKFQFADFIMTNHESFVPRARIARGVSEHPLSDELVQRIRDSKSSGSDSRNEPRKDAESKEDKVNVKSRSEKEERWTVPTERWSMPDNPVNEYGMTLRAMRCLEITESVCQLRDLMDFGAQHNLGPIQALRRLAGEYRAARANAAGSDMSSGKAGPKDTDGSEGRRQDGDSADGKAEANGSGAGKRKNVHGEVKVEGEGEELRESTSPHKRMR